MQNSSVIRTRPRRRAAAPAKEVPWSFILLVIACACIVAAGFFFAARQHFTSMDYGLKNSKLREQLESLEAEKRRLLLAREVALSPASVGKAAREIGLRDAGDEVAAVQASLKTGSDTPGAPPNVQTVKTASAVSKSSGSRIIPAVMSAPVQSGPAGETRRRIADSQKEKKEKVEVAALWKLK